MAINNPKPREIDPADFSIDANGHITTPNNCMFTATATASQDNQTGNGDTRIVNFENERFDRNADYNGVNQFTAPVTGAYRISTTVKVNGLTASHTTGELNIVTSNKTYEIFNGNIGGMRNAAGATAVSGSVLADMDAADTARVEITVSGSTKVVDIEGGDTCVFSIELIG